MWVNICPIWLVIVIVDSVASALEIRLMLACLCGSFSFRCSDYSAENADLFSSFEGLVS